MRQSDITNGGLGPEIERARGKVPPARKHQLGAIFVRRELRCRGREKQVFGAAVPWVLGGHASPIGMPTFY